MTVSGPCWTVRTTHTGYKAPMVLKRSTLPAAQPEPQPMAARVKYGWPVAGLVGAMSGAIKQTTQKSHRILIVVLSKPHKNRLRQIGDHPTPECFLLNLTRCLPGIHDKAVDLD